MKIYSSAALALGFSLPVLASDLYRATPFELNISHAADAEIENTGSPAPELSSSEVELKAIFSTWDLDQGKLILGSQLRYTQYQFSGNNIADKDLYEIYFPLTYIRRVDRWTHITRLSLGLSSDFEEVDQEDLAAAAIYRALYKSTRHLDWVVGLGVNRNFGDVQAFPILGANYQASPQWRYELVLPQIKISYKPQRNYLFFFQLKPNGRQWNVEEEQSGNDVDITTKEIRTSLGFSYQSSNKLRLTLELGQLLERSIEVTDINDQEQDVDLEDSTQLSLSLGLSF